MSNSINEHARQRRNFLKRLAAAGFISLSPQLASAAGADYRRLLVLVELKGANDGLNTVIPFADPEYARLRPRIGIRRDEIIPLDERSALHPSLQPLMALWQQRELAIVQSIGYPSPNLSHFRSIEIWETASRSDQYLSDGWLARTFTAYPTPATYVADGVVIASNELGPLAGSGVRAIALSDAEQFARQTKLAHPGVASGNAALRHLLKVEDDVVSAANRLHSGYLFKTGFPRSAFGNAVKAGCQVVASGSGVAALRLTLNGFDTHQNQPATHANLLKQLAEGLLALKDALGELGRWDDTLVMTYSEFGRRPRENQSNGTDHGTAAPHFVLGGRVRGGLYGEAPKLDRLDGNGNLPFSLDYRSLYATVLERWWGVSSATVLGARYPALEFIRS
ncbi:MAG: DUF1501 domain-containing protein [Propionivibrio sp.]|uniref:DUF1501 domain-containing protein n=1 Tax=Propionivibrio sp. TaxID=2212460 RepID=UPI001A5C0C62|nr:DUF1501 domain-containing protein [Propionivibrio sp.]MBL8414878.1 DUF1501 domain-containing protein [Propionivibrio sp.]